MTGELPLLKMHPAVHAAWAAYQAGDHRGARAHLATLPASETTAADTDALNRMRQGLAFDWAPWIVALVCACGWAALFLRAA